MDIALCIDDNYVKQCALLMRSIEWHNSAETEIIFHIFSFALSKKNRLYLSDGVKNRVIFYDLLGTDVLSTSVNEANLHVTKATYFRFYLESRLPASLHKVLYLDADMLVTDSLKSLYEENLQDFAVAAAHDICNDDILRYNALDYEMNEGYFNAGMLLINLDWWRKNDVSARALKFIHENPEKCLLNDQDALNHILHGYVKFVSSSFNSMVTLYINSPDRIRSEKRLLAKMYRAFEEPVIIHYTDFIKPWFTEYKKASFPFARLFECYNKKLGVNLKARSYFGLGNFFFKRIPFLKKAKAWGLFMLNAANVKKRTAEKKKVIEIEKALLQKF